MCEEVQLPEADRLSLMLFHSKADCIPPPHRLHPAASQTTSCRLTDYIRCLTERYITTCLPPSSTPATLSPLLRGLSASGKDPLVIDHFCVPYCHMAVLLYNEAWCAWGCVCVEEGRQSERHSRGGTDSELVVSTSMGCGGTEDTLAAPNRCLE